MSKVKVTIGLVIPASVEFEVRVHDGDYGDVEIISARSTGASFSSDEIANYMDDDGSLALWAKARKAAQAKELERDDTVGGVDRYGAGADCRSVV